MSRTVAIGIQDFEKIRESGLFYVDKTAFIKEWWNSQNSVTLITRPRRFGKTLNMSMVNCFFSNKYENRADLFEGLSVWEDEKFRKLQGTYPVIFLSFAGVKAKTYEETVQTIKIGLANLFSTFSYLMESDRFDDNQRKQFQEITEDMDDVHAALSLNLLSKLLEIYYEKKVLIFLDEYDTPLQEAYINGYWDELVAFTRALFNNTFKTNPSLERAIMTGITRVSKESIFSDLNNLNVITTTSDRYATAFGFTEDEVFAAMDEQKIDAAEKEKVKFWYDGFTFGKVPDIYNPWSVILYLSERKYGTHWANTSGNGLVGKLLREGDKKIKTEFEKLLNGECIETEIDEQIIFSQLSEDSNAVWSLLLASGYLKAVSAYFGSDGEVSYKLALTNFEVKCMFKKMIKGWFAKGDAFGEFVTAMLRADMESMNHYINRVAQNTFSSFDTGNKPSEQAEPERFYHGFVLGLIADKSDKYLVKSNRESGFGRYDVVMEPKDVSDVAVIMEFKVHNPNNGEKDLTDTAENALKQIEDKKYDTDLLERGIPAERIYKYGFAFEGERCLIVKGA